MKFSSLNSQSNGQSDLSTGIKTSWKGIVVLALFFIAIAFFFKWVIMPSNHIESKFSSPTFVVNEAFVANIAEEYKLPQQQVRSLLRLQNSFSALDNSLKSSIDSVNHLILIARTKGDSLSLTSLELEVLNLDIRFVDNRYHYYSFVKSSIAKARALELLSALNVHNNLLSESEN